MNRAEARSTTPTPGLPLKEKEAFIRSALSSMATHTFGFICSVIGVSDRTTGRHCGSALRCRLDGRRAILTALRVIEEAKKEPRGIAISTGYGEPPFVVHGPVNIDSLADLAVYFLPDEYRCSDSAFWSSKRIEHSPDKLATDYLFLHGFPGKTSDSSQLLRGVVNKSLPYGAMQRLENLPPNLQSFQFGVEYDPVGMVNETGAAQDLVDPHGLSGSPVWRIGISGRSSREWRPDDSLLVGILTQWSPSNKVLIATSTEKLPPDW
ncbi:MAG TPA: hypothetical protein VMV69_13280 [Pirellulales bacterium]|nr:hypothetical protein [Pirellulales bacterium]